MWAPDAYKVSGTFALRHFLIAVGVLASFSGLVYYTVPEPPMLRKVRAFRCPLTLDVPARGPRRGLWQPVRCCMLQIRV